MAKNITMKQFNGTSYDVLYPATVASQVVSGVFNVSRGRTGASDPATARNNLGAAPMYTYGTTDLEAGVTELATGKLHFVYDGPSSSGGGGGGGGMSGTPDLYFVLRDSSGSSQTCPSESGKTWAQWVVSSYNTYDVAIDSSGNVKYNGEDLYEETTVSGSPVYTKQTNTSVITASTYIVASRME